MVNFYKKYNNQTGSLFIELIAGVLIVGLIVLIINNLPLSLRLVGQSKREALAQQIASKEVEDLRSQTYANLAYTNSPTSFADPRISQLPNGSGTYEVKPCPGLSDPQPICKNNPVEQTKYAIINVYWKENGNVRTVRLDTLISSGGLQ